LFTPNDAVNNEPLLQFGVTVSKRYFKKAVDRNRIKRQVREIYRVEKGSLKAVLQQKGTFALKVFFIYSGKEKPLFDVLQVRIKQIIKRLENEVSKA